MRSLALGTVASYLLLNCAWAAAPGDWPSYGYDAAGGRFSPLRQITPANVDRLAVAWTYHMNPEPAAAAAGPEPPTTGRGAFTTETTPLKIGNVLYLGTPYGRVVALDADTGAQIWVYTLPAKDNPPLRGLNYWAGSGRAGPRILFGTLGGRLIALDAKTGLPVQGFGENGVVNLKTPEVMNGFPNAPYGVTSPGAIYRNLIILGARVQEAPALGPSGDVRAYNVRDGRLVWTFHAIPQPGERGHDTWEGDSWKQRSGVNVWNMMSVDTARGIVYLPFGAPTLDRFGGDRKGANLYSGSLVAVDAQTGKYRWHYQVLHHDIWDFDLGTPPLLLEVRKGGKKIPAVAAMNKSALLFLLNRVTGEPIYAVTETPVPQSTVAAERAAPTQPIPVKPVQLARNRFALDEVATVTPELKASCEAWITRDRLQPSERYSPITMESPIVRFPGGAGGPLWAGGALDPTLGYFIVNTNDRGSVEQVVQRSNGSWSVTSLPFRDSATGMPCQQPPWGSLTAVNVNTGDIAWRVNLGVTDIAPPGARNTGRQSNGGPIVTASGLTFIAGTDDARIRAFDSRTGAELWAYKLEYSAHATPMTYAGRQGRQYVAIVATGGSPLGSPSGGDSLVVFALPAGVR
jgi:quinoprotein glucose dehydrogenase